MPYKIRKAKCKQSSGRSGSYVLSYVDNKGKRHSNCHTSRKKAKAQIAAIEMPESRNWTTRALHEIVAISEELRHLKTESNLDPEWEVLRHGEELGFLHDEESNEEAERLAAELVAGEIRPSEVPLYLAMNVASWLGDYEEKGRELGLQVLHHHRHGMGGTSESRAIIDT